MNDSSYNETRMRSINRRDARLRRHREKGSALQDAFLDSVKAWRERDATAGNRFIEHMENCTAASSTTVLGSDLMLWFPNLPEEVQDKLEALSIYYHIDATLMRDLKNLEASLGGWSAASPLHFETLHAAEHTVTQHVRLGPGDNDRLGTILTQAHHCGRGATGENCIRVQGYAVGDWPLTVRILLLRIMANFSVRKTLLEGRPEVRGQVARWVDTTMLLMAAGRPENLREMDGTIALFEKINRELKEWKDWSDQEDAKENEALDEVL